MVSSVIRESFLSPAHRLIETKPSKAMLAGGAQHVRSAALDLVREFGVEELDIVLFGRDRTLASVSRDRDAVVDTLSLIWERGMKP
jgi:hypothetical protein